MSLDPPAIVILFALGLAVGSFLNVCIHRLPLRLSLVSPGSRCPNCGYELRWFDNIPVASYAILRGRCRQCRTRISWQYPIVELVTMALFLVHGFAFGWTALLAVRLLFACAMVVLFAIDLEHQILPDVITLPGIVIGWAAATVLPPGLSSALVGGVGRDARHIVDHIASRQRDRNREAHSRHGRQSIRDRPSKTAASGL